MLSECFKIIVISPCKGGYGGLESFVLAVAAGVAKLPCFRVKIVFKKTKDFLLQDSLLRKIHESEVQVIFCNRASFALWREVKNSDLVHLQNPCPDVVLMARLSGKPLLINVINHTKSVISLHKLLWKLCLHLAHKRFYISNFVRTTWESTPSPWQNSRVVFPICQLSTLQPLPACDRSGFVFLARWIENKGLDTLVQAYADARLEPNKWPLRLLGDGPLRMQILAQVRELGLEGVIMPGFVSEHDKNDYIRRSRFAVIPPNTCEDFGLVAIEARHLGLPCLITRDGGVSEAAGRHCLSCEPGDVDGLKNLLLKAAAMSERDYSTLASAAHQSLCSELINPSFYAHEYVQLIRHLPNNHW